jgi:hypothetical protein
LVFVFGATYETALGVGLRMLILSTENCCLKSTVFLILFRFKDYFMIDLTRALPPQSFR